MMALGILCPSFCPLCVYYYNFPSTSGADTGFWKDWGGGGGGGGVAIKGKYAILDLELKSS